LLKSPDIGGRHSARPCMTCGADGRNIYSLQPIELTAVRCFVNRLLFVFTAGFRLGYD